MSVEDGGPAFPGLWTNASDSNQFAPDKITVVPPGHTFPIRGMSLRDYFAAKVLEGMFAGAGRTFQRAYPTFDDVAKHCFEQADAMLKARKA